MKELQSPPATPVPWIVWDIGQPTNFCTVVARTWVTACEQGRLRLGCSRVDGSLESNRPLEKIHRVDACILCNMSPCICSKTNPPPPPIHEPSIRECQNNLYISFISTTDPKQKAICRDKMLALIFRKLFDL